MSLSWRPDGSQVQPAGLGGKNAVPSSCRTGGNAIETEEQCIFFKLSTQIQMLGVAHWKCSTSSSHQHFANLLFGKHNDFDKTNKKAAPTEIDDTVRTRLKEVIINAQTWHTHTRQTDTPVKFKTSLLSQVIVSLPRYSQALAEFATKEVQIVFGAGISGIQIIPAAGILLFRARALLLSA